MLPNFPLDNSVNARWNERKQQFVDDTKDTECPICGAILKHGAGVQGTLSTQSATGCVSRVQLTMCKHCVTPDVTPNTDRYASYVPPFMW